MIITGGENIFPAEVEDVLYQHAAVAEAAVIGLPDQRWGQRVHAVVALWPGHHADSEDLAKLCCQRLAAYKRPRSFEFRDALPKTGAGKIDRTLLAAESESHG